MRVLVTGGAGYIGSHTAKALAAAGYTPESARNGNIVLKDEKSTAHPEEIATLLVEAGAPPTRLTVEEEELEAYFLRLVGMDGGSQNE